MCRRLVLLMTLVVCLVTSFDSAHAAKRKKKKTPRAPAGKIVQPADVFETSVKVGKRSIKIACLAQAPGYTRKNTRGLMFISYSSVIKKEKKTEKKALYRKILTQGKKDCQTPDFLSLQRHAGAFGEREARRLYELFAFGASPEEIAAAVAAGLDATTNRLLTYISDPNVDSTVRNELYCDGVLPGHLGTPDADNEACDAGDINAVDFSGVRYNEYFRMLYSQNPFFSKSWMFLHDERMAVSSQVLDGCERHALPTYVDMLRRATISGDYYQLMREKNSDHLLHLQYLDGASNKGYSPNENYAREFWELGTVGATGRDGRPVYTDDDIAQSALAFTGWSVQGFERDDRWVCLRAYVPDNHAPYAKTIFNGTPYQTTVYNDEDVLRATFNHPRTAEHLAEDLWKEFINPFPTNAAIQQLAQVIRSSNYNLIPVYRTIMRSQALYAPRSRNSLIKHPTDLLMGFLRTSGMPLHYRTIDSYLQRMGQQPLLAPSVFGWNERSYTDEAHVQDWRNVALSLTTRGSDELSKLNYSLHARFLTNLPGTETVSRETIKRVAAWFNVDLNERQIQKLDDYMNYRLERCTKDCNGQVFTLKRDLFDTHIEGNWETKIRGLISIIIMLPDYVMK